MAGSGFAGHLCKERRPCRRDACPPRGETNGDCGKCYAGERERSHAAGGGGLRGCWRRLANLLAESVNLLVEDICALA